MPFSLTFCCVRLHVTRSVTTVRQAEQATGGGEKKTHKPLRSAITVSESFTFATSHLPPCLLLSPLFPFHLFSNAMHVATSDSNLHDAIVLCLPAALLKRVCVCVSTFACACLSLSVFAGVNVCRLEASQLKLQWKGRGECSKPIFISQSNQRHAADTAHGRETTLHWHASLIVYVVWVPQCC